MITTSHARALPPRPHVNRSNPMRQRLDRVIYRVAQCKRTTYEDKGGLEPAEPYASYAPGPPAPDG